MARQLATESALLAAAAAALAILLASWMLRVLVSLAPSRVPRLDDVTLDPTAVLVTAILSLAVTVAFASGPLLHVHADTFTALK